MATSARFVRAATVGTLGEGRVLAARLESEGIEVRVHSAATGPYPLTVGEMAETELWVMSDRLEEATTILLDADIRTALAPVEFPESDGPRSGDLRLVALVAALVFTVVWVLRLVRVF